MFGLTKTSASETPLMLTPSRADLLASCPVFATMEEATAYRRQLTQEMTEAAIAGDSSNLCALQSRYEALPPLICALVVKRAHERLAGWQNALARQQEAYQEAIVQEQAAKSAYVQAQEAQGMYVQDSTNALRLARQMASGRKDALSRDVVTLEEAVRAAQQPVRQAQDALTLAVSNPNAGLQAADQVLGLLQQTQDVFLKQTRQSR